MGAFLEAELWGEWGAGGAGEGRGGFGGVHGKTPPGDALIRPLHGPGLLLFSGI